MGRPLLGGLTDGASARQTFAADSRSSASLLDGYLLCDATVANVSWSVRANVPDVGRLAQDPHVPSQVLKEDWVPPTKTDFFWFLG